MVFTKFTQLLALAALATTTTGLVTATDVSGPNVHGIHVHPSVHRTLRAQGAVNIIVTLRGGTDAAINAVKESQFDSRGEKINNLVNALKTNAEQAQKEVTALLAKEADGNLFTRSENYWITNQVFIEGASVELIEKLLASPSIAEIAEEEVFQLYPIEVADTAASGPNNATTDHHRQLQSQNEYGVTKINAPQVWARGYNGQGVVVGHIDSGARYTHQAIRNNFRSAYGWFDPESKTATPYDRNGHGTHTIGTIVGAGGIGVAPGARWIACKGCRSSSCPESDLLACGQFMTCPTNTAGTAQDCSQAPDLVSNSWGGGQGSTSYKRVVDAWRAAGIVPVFAIGNSGPNCRTANSPGDLPNVIGVGATDANDRVASFSSKGPAVTGLVKPDVSAPGVNTRSAWISSDSAYNSISGTSMATPHVSGAVALLLSARSSLTYDQIRSALTGTASKGVTTDRTCGAPSNGQTNEFGFGRIDANAAVSRALQL
ncbi:hypothetical protein PINS_up005812 [Pythium insidiosum]|nr:hypothetical protein PINS_up005812 [Pythium insidiosum]